MYLESLYQECHGSSHHRTTGAAYSSKFNVSQCIFGRGSQSSCILRSSVITAVFLWWSFSHDVHHIVGPVGINTAELFLSPVPEGLVLLLESLSTIDSPNQIIQLTSFPSMFKLLHRDLPVGAALAMLNSWVRVALFGLGIVETTMGTARIGFFFRSISVNTSWERFGVPAFHTHTFH